MPTFVTPKVARDLHIEVARGLHSGTARRSRPARRPAARAPARRPGGRYGELAGGGAGQPASQPGIVDAEPGGGPARRPPRRLHRMVEQVDITRFASDAHLVSWAKFCPQVHESAGKSKNKGRGKGNPWLAGTLGNIVATASRTNSFSRGALPADRTPPRQAAGHRGHRF